VHETRERQLDDWLGEISDDDWSEQPTDRVARRRATSDYQELSVPEGELLRDSAHARPTPARPVTTEANRAVIGRRRLAAGLVLAAVLGLVVAIPLLFLRGGDQASVTSLPETTTTSPAPTETTASPAPTTSSPSNSTPPPATTTPSTGEAA
jgi:ferric-dicitrate binding protein FerR (iron transport regulator)